MGQQSAKMRHAETLKPIEIRQVPQRGNTRFAPKLRGKSTLLALIFAVPGFVMTATFAGPRSRGNLDGQASPPTLTQVPTRTATTAITLLHSLHHQAIPIN